MLLMPFSGCHLSCAMGSKAQYSRARLLSSQLRALLSGPGRLSCHLTASCTYKSDTLSNLTRRFSQHRQTSECRQQAVSWSSEEILRSSLFVQYRRGSEWGGVSMLIGSVDGNLMGQLPLAGLHPMASKRARSSCRGPDTDACKVWQRD